MNEHANPRPPDDQPDGALQFDQAESAATAVPMSCAACGEPIGDSYYEVNGRVTCARCRTTLEQPSDAGSSVGRFARATVLGLLAAGAGFGIYYGIAKLTGMEFSIIAIVVGVMVGSAVKRGSNGRGGWRYQLLAVFLTYTAIVSTYVPFIVEGFRERAQADSLAAPPVTRPPGDTAGAPGASPAADTTGASVSAAGFVLGLILLIGFVYAVPFLAGLENILGLLIIAIGLYAAWKTAARVMLKVTGPYRVAAAPAT